MSSGQIRIDCGRAGPAATESSSGCACSGGGDRRCICRRRDRWDGGLELQVQWVQVQVRIRVQDFVLRTTYIFNADNVVLYYFSNFNVRLNRTKRPQTKNPIRWKSPKCQFTIKMSNGFKFLLKKLKICVIIQVTKKQFYIVNI